MKERRKKGKKTKKKGKERERAGKRGERGWWKKALARTSASKNRRSNSIDRSTTRKQKKAVPENRDASISS